MDFATLIVLGNAMVLGIRHGIDWDHIAAIADIVGTASASNTSSSTKSGDRALSLAPPDAALKLAWSYALGHAAIVLVLGIAALAFSSVLPEWIDPLMEKAVGVTLLLLGAWIFYSLSRQSVSDESEFVLQSRWMFIASTLQKKYAEITGKELDIFNSRSYSGATAFGIGVIHGFGAETGTQVLLIAAVGGAANHVLGVTILLSFISGLLISNSLVALVTMAGFSNSARMKPLFVAISVITGIFSLIVGAIFLAGQTSLLPNLQG
ncbi:MAG: hypothetical protein U0103_30115 [Candidatus Obscuribacterales bacterium]